MKCPRCDIDMVKLDQQTTAAEENYHCTCCGSSAKKAYLTTVFYINNDMSGTSHYACGHPVYHTSLEFMPTHLA